MSTLKGYARLLTIGRPVLTTAEVASALGIAKPSATRFLHMLAKAGLGTHIRRGLWVLSRNPHAYELVEFLTAPYPGYISMWTALHEHGAITQVPSIIYIVSLDRSKKIATPFATFEIHHIAPRLFGGFDRSNGAPLAKVEKALFDTVYLLVTRGERSMRFPEITLPDTFDKGELHRWIARISLESRRSYVRKQIDRILSKAGAVA